MQEVSAVETFFRPKSVAVVGASTDPKKAGHTVLKNLVSMGYQGKIFPINPHEDSILGFRCYKSVLDIPEPVEICVLLVSADLTMQVAKELVQRKSRFNDIVGAVCMSAGFGELDVSDTKQREKELVQTLRSASIRLVGPNCLGIIDAYTGFNTNFDISHYPKGGLSILTQSGAFGNSFLYWAENLRLIGLSKFASIGNMADVSMAELLTVLKDDESTRVIAIYMEGLPHPREFFEVAREVSAVKPIVVMKTGKSDVGSAAALSHTGAVAGADAIYDGAFKQAGIIRARSVLEFFDTLRAFERQPIPEGNRVSVLTHMGGPGTICIDEISATGNLRLAKFSPETQTALKSICAPMANIGRPDGYIDLTAAHTEKLHNQVLKILFQDENVDVVVQILAPSAHINQKLIVKEILDAYQSQPGKKKPLFHGVVFGHFAIEVRQGLENAGLPTFVYPDMLARVVGNVASFAANRRLAASIAQDRKAVESDLQLKRMPAAGLIAAASKQGRVSLLEPEAYQVCRDYGIRVPPFRLTDSVESAIHAANEIGYPVVLKVVSEEILHKTDVGGVMLGISSDDALRAAHRKLVENIARTAPRVGNLKFLVQKMMPATTELVLGAVRDKSFGPTVMFGLGGIYIEALKLVGFRLSPLGIQEARELIRQTLPPALLKGVRGGAPMNLDSVANTLVSLGRLLEEQPQIEEVDLNPTLPYADGCMAVDARIIISKG
ncbi:MAG TPA: acetate--CoA ligase family protein [Candidatus Polarisedimenticolia bacterium]|nr:acetate--CoA ligase family protein [Candidatus Polarisedimenticolia bacterium]